MAFIPKFELYDATGLNKLYTFPAVYKTNAPQSVANYVEVTGFRGKGSIIIPGGEQSWDLEMSFVLVAEDYEALTALIDGVEAIALNTPYILKIGKYAVAPNSGTETHYEYNVKRIVPFEYEESLRTNYQKVNATFRVNSW
jgi:hypothetical protein